MVPLTWLSGPLKAHWAPCLPGAAVPISGWEGRGEPAGQQKHVLSRGGEPGFLSVAASFLRSSSRIPRRTGWSPLVLRLPPPTHCGPHTRRCDAPGVFHLVSSEHSAFLSDWAMLRDS